MLSKYFRGRELKIVRISYLLFFAPVNIPHLPSLRQLTSFSWGNFPKGDYSIRAMPVRCSLWIVYFGLLMISYMETIDAQRVSIGVYLDRSNPGYLMYTVLVCVMLGTALALPFVHAEVSVGSPGVLRPVSVNTPVKSFSAGVVMESRARDNMRVVKGELLVRVRSVELEAQQKHAHDRLADLTLLLRDVSTLLTSVSKAALHDSFDCRLETAAAQQWLSDFLQRYRDALAIAGKAKRDHQRSSTLFKNEVIAPNEMETADEELRKSEQGVSRIVQMQLTQWQQAALQYEAEIAGLKKTLSEGGLVAELNQIVAPVNGTLQQMTGLYPGSLVFSGQEIGYISPDTTLVAEVHVAPGDIGLIREGLQTRFQVTAFNYNEWGVLEGEVINVADDVVVSDDMAYYVVLCRIAQPYLQLTNGYRGSLRKGMSVNARFIIGRRSLWQLLYDNVDDWVNPTRSTGSRKDR